MKEDNFIDIEIKPAPLGKYVEALAGGLAMNFDGEYRPFRYNHSYKGNITYDVMQKQFYLFNNGHQYSLLLVFAYRCL